MQAYFRDEDYISVEHGPFRPSRLRFEWAKGSILDDNFFVNPGYGALACSKRMFEHFLPLLEDQARIDIFTISGAPYVIFVPNTELDLIDLNQSEFKTTASGKPHRFSKVALKDLPPPTLNFFALAGSLALRHIFIVTDEFKEIYDRHECGGLRFAEVVSSLG